MAKALYICPDTRALAVRNRALVAGTLADEPDCVCGNSDGACCYFSGFCQVVSQAVCAQTPLTIWRGPGTTCGASACPLGACCTGTNCVQRPEHACISSGGTWLGPGVPCTPTNPCAQVVIPCCQQINQTRCYRLNPSQPLGAMTFTVTGTVSANCCGPNGVINSASINVGFSQSVVPTLQIDQAGCVTSFQASVFRAFNGAMVTCFAPGDLYNTLVEVFAGVSWSSIGGFVTELRAQGGTASSNAVTIGAFAPPTGANGGCFADSCTATQGIPANPMGCNFSGGSTPFWPLTGSLSVSVTAPSNWATCPNAPRPVIDPTQRTIISPAQSGIVTGLSSGCSGCSDANRGAALI